MALRVDGPRPDPTHLSLYGMLLLNAAYSAARPETGLARPSCSSSSTKRPEISARHATTAGRLSGLPR
jgi:hypothetical protein